MAVTYHYNAPPTWPAPPAGWQPDLSWPPALPGWVFWLPDESPDARKPAAKGSAVVIATRVTAGLLTALWLAAFAVSGWGSFLIGLGLAALLPGLIAAVHRPARAAGGAVTAAGVALLVVGATIARIDEGRVSGCRSDERNRYKEHRWVRSTVDAMHRAHDSRVRGTV